MKPIELVYLGVALLIVAQQLIVRKGQFDPVALGAITLFVGLVPATRADRRKNADSEQTANEIVSQRSREMLKRWLDKGE